MVPSEERMTEEQKILAECRAGNLERFAVLYDTYVADVFKFVYFKTHHKETAEDITSLVFTKALQSIRSFEGTSRPFNAWLFTIARNTVIDHYRSYREHADITDIWDLANNEDIARDAQLRMQLGKVQEYMKDLTVEQREIVLLRVWQDLPYKEIAEIMGKSEASCKMMFSRVVSKMNKDIVALLILMSVLNIH